MRLVDADALKAKSFGKRGGLIHTSDIDAMPTVDAVPVVHGEWIDKDGGIATCSVCGDRWGVWSVMKYCPNCGAKMNEEDNEQKKQF